MTARVWRVCAAFASRGLLLLALLLAFVLPAAADVAVPELTGRVVDQTGTLSSGDIAALTQRLRDFETRKGSQVVVLIVPTTQPETIEQFSIRVAEAWKIGRKKIDDGAILVVAKNDRHVRIEVGYGLEGALTDVTSRRIIDEIITPKFRTGDFAGGISDGVERMLRVIDGEPLPVPTPTVNFGNLDDLGPLLPVMLFGSLIVGGFMRALLGRLLGSFATGGLIGVLAWLVLGSLGVAAVAGIISVVLAFIADLFPTSTGSSRGGSWSSGSSSGGWSSGSSSSDSGGFSGGGGSFGGGGASGSW
ncbi:YgcG family protein [Bradyrhizobium diazoefficiens]|nr:YgcG family protein [Bradyrhizobium diazoefficiens]MBR0965864.1 YgcG family protein [Bradyrhizobium diazoefficiens]MBR0975839.1 YgcG family protein [Bradyrhizobium diazoefficiens]MBR1008871.1 YgcG family protein [Bradyrhizobium diazoefficiens]MBR1015141.1 YgcG family protein [Bradyrhizobium diazoefficiens]MBR1052814.1 YgcG family protein [Bradyrhizobium diazoefficiens]